jgi:hypothetical protein
MRWPTLHEQILARVWPEMGDKCAPMFPEYTLAGIRHKARRMGLVYVADDEAEEPLVTCKKDRRNSVSCYGFIKTGSAPSIFHLAQALEAA